MLSKIVWGVLLSTIASSVAGQKPQFHRNNRPNQRGIIGQRVELPCMVRNVDGTMELSWQRNNIPITRGSEVVTDDARFSIRDDKQSNTYMLIINPAAAEDSGNYECVVTMARGQGRIHVSKIFSLQVIEYTPQLGWRGDGKCGEYNFLPAPLHHEEAGCDALGSYPCCSMFGWCGFTDDFCDCPSCVDYSAIEASPCGPGFRLVGDNSTCVHVGKASMDYETARMTCEHLSSTLIPKPSGALTAQQFSELTAGSQHTRYWLLGTRYSTEVTGAMQCWSMVILAWEGGLSAEYQLESCQDFVHPYALCVKPRPL